jgi:CHAT domain-containing protein
MSKVFDFGFEIVESPSPDGKIVSKVEGPARANVKAQRRVGNEVYYISDWSWDRIQRGKSGNWMRAVQGRKAPEMPKTPPLPRGVALSERTYDRVFGNGYEVVDSPAPGARVLKTVREPSMITVAAEAGIRHFLTPEANAVRLQGGTFHWLRERTPRPQPELLPRMRALLGSHSSLLEADQYTNRPWMFSARLYEVDPGPALVAMREFGIFPYLTEMAPFYEDREYPLDWMREAARFLHEEGKLEEAIEVLKGHLPNRFKEMELWQRSEEAEMMPGYVRQHIQFDQRTIALLEAGRGNFAEVEAILSPLIANWNPDQDGLNASGPKINMLREIARAQWKTGSVTDARRSTRIWLKAYARDIANEILHPDYYSASERVMEFDNDFEAVGDYYELLEAVTDPEIAAEIVVGLKGLRLAVESSARFRREGNSDPAVADLVKELLDLEEAAQKEELEGKPANHQRRDQIARLQARLATLRLTGVGIDLSEESEWARLSSEIAKRRAAGEEDWNMDELIQRRDLLALEHLIEKGRFMISPDDIQASLRPREALVDFFRTPPARFGESGNYAAIILKKEGDAQLIQIGESETVDALVKRYRDFLLGIGGFQEDTLEQLNGRLDQEIRSAYEVVFQPLTPHIGGIERLVLCPEGQLSFLPFDFLGENADSLVQSRWEVTYVNAARDLTRVAKRPKDGTKSALLVGNPDFEGNVAGGTTTSEAVLDEVSRAMVAEAARGIEFAPLPGTGEEIAGLAPMLQSAGFQVESISGASATEARLLDSIRSPDVLHLATHGFFLNSLPVANQGASERRNQSAMLLSGLALTGAQKTLESWNQGRIPDPGNDGILFASEVARLDLSGTGTVVLSACDTAVGRALSGEGVEGLRSGLTLAGAQNVVVTLWPVDDLATVEVMKHFYGKLLAGEAAPTALANTKKELLVKMTDEFDVFRAHRFIGPFLLTRTGALP